MNRYRHFFDFGIFVLFKIIDNETALFYDDNEFGKINIIKPELRLIKYKLNEMRPI